MGNPFMAAMAAMAAVAVMSMGTFLALEKPSWLPVFGEEKSDTVLVFLVGSRRGVETVKKSVDPARIVAETPNAIALVEGRMVAVDAAAVSEPLMAAGWADRPLELLQVPRDDGLNRGEKKGTGEQSGEDAARIDRIMELMNKPSLTQGEALFVLNAMDDGLM